MLQRGIGHGGSLLTAEPALDRAPLIGEPVSRQHKVHKQLLQMNAIGSNLINLQVGHYFNIFWIWLQSVIKTNDSGCPPSSEFPKQRRALGQGITQKVPLTMFTTIPNKACLAFLVKALQNVSATTSQPNHFSSEVNDFRGFTQVKVRSMRSAKTGILWIIEFISKPQHNSHSF